jgi:hypothetical protein
VSCSFVSEKSTSEYGEIKTVAGRELNQPDPAGILISFGTPDAELISYPFYIIWPSRSIVDPIMAARLVGQQSRKESKHERLKVSNRPTEATGIRRRADAGTKSERSRAWGCA